MKNKISLPFICLSALLLSYPAVAIECQIIQYDADSYEAGDRVAELGVKPKVAVGQDNDIRYFTGKHIDLQFDDAPVSASQIEIMADLHEDKETIFKLFSARDGQSKPVLQFHQNYHHLWVTDGGKKKSRGNERYYRYKKSNQYRFVFKKGTIRAFLNQEYIGSVEANNQIFRITVTELNDADKIFSIQISPSCTDTSNMEDSPQ